MPLNPSSVERSGYEYYTKEETVKKIVQEYQNVFGNSNLIWLPFNSDDKPIYRILSNIYGKGKVITNPHKEEWWNEELGCYDF
jgi:hypothetical protein